MPTTGCCAGKRDRGVSIDDSREGLAPINRPVPLGHENFEGLGVIAVRIDRGDGCIEFTKGAGTTGDNPRVGDA